LKKEERVREGERKEGRDDDVKDKMKMICEDHILFIMYVYMGFFGATTQNAILPSLLYVSAKGERSSMTDRKARLRGQSSSRSGRRASTPHRGCIDSYFG
jgi:hypothetical protein